MTYTLDIDTYIGGYYGTKKVVKNVLASNAGKPVSVRVNSYGGSVDDGLDISAQFEAHGNVTVDLFAFNASAATLLTMGAQTVRAHVNSLYLIHKVMSWIDEFGYMNEDDIQTLIDKLTAEKKDNEKITLVAARMYANRSGKKITEILDLMKQETWLTAQEAKDWGFVDEVFGKASENKINFSSEMKEKFNAAGLPLPDRKHLQNQNDESGFSSLIEKGFNCLADKFDSLIDKMNPSASNSLPNNIITMHKEFLNINAILGLEGVEISEDGKVNITQDQLQKINEAIKKVNEEKQAAEKSVTEKETALNTLQTEFDNFKNAAGDDTPPVPKPADGGAAANTIFDTFKNAKALYDILPD